MMKYVNIGLAVVIAIVAIVAGVFFIKQKNASDEVVQEQTQIAEKLSTQEDELEEGSTEATSYVELPGWTARSDVKGDKEGISLEQANAASKESSKTTTASSNSSSKTSNTTTTPDASAKATTTADASASTTATTSATAATTATTADVTDKATWALAPDITADKETGHYYRDLAGGLHYEAHKFETKYNDSKHWKECSVCKYKTTGSAHSFNDDHDCTECGFECPHTNWSWQMDSTSHKKVCNVCGKTWDSGPHDFDGNTCKQCKFTRTDTGSNTSTDKNQGGTSEGNGGTSGGNTTTDGTTTGGGTSGGNTTGGTSDKDQNGNTEGGGSNNGGGDGTSNDGSGADALLVTAE